MAQTLGQFVVANRVKIFEQAAVHLQLVVLSVLIAAAISVPVGIILARHSRLARPVTGVASIMQTVPSIALLGILIPFLGIGWLPALFALVVYAILPILNATLTGIKGVDPVLKESAEALGLTSAEQLMKIELPLALPVIVTGLRTAAVINVGVATLAAYIGAGGLGEFIFGGISLSNPVMMLAGAIPAALLALVVDFVFLIMSDLRKLSAIRVSKGLYFLLGIGLLAGAAFLVRDKFLKAQAGDRLLAGFTPEFIGRSDGLPAIEQGYGLNLKNLVINDAIMYKAVQEQKLDIISGYSTDGRIKLYDLVLLRDDKNIFPTYFASALVSEKTLTKYPELESVLEKLKGLINDKEMTSMNFQLDVLKKDPETVAADFLKSKSLFHKPRSGKKGVVTIGGKLFGEQQILIHLYSALIEGYTELQTKLKGNLGGTQICFEALKKGSIDFYPEYSGTALYVLLQKKNLNYKDIQRDLLATFHVKLMEPIGFNNAYALMMRKSQAVNLRIVSLSNLAEYDQRENLRSRRLK